MMRLVAVAFVLAVASSAQAIQPALIQQTNDVVIKVREACGPGFHMVGGTCVRTPAHGRGARAIATALVG